MAGTMAPRRRGMVRALGAALALALLACVVIGVQAMLADPAIGDTRTPATLSREGLLVGSRMQPARIGYDSMSWPTALGTVTVAVLRADLAPRGAKQLHEPTAHGGRCDQRLVVQLRVSYLGSGTYAPAEDLQVQRMRTPFEAVDAEPGLEELRTPLLDPAIELADGSTVTGDVLFTAPAGSSARGNIVVSTAEGAAVHVDSGLAGSGRSPGC